MNKVKINIQGKRIDSFINRLINANVEIVHLDYLSNKEINIIIYQKDYKKIKKIKTIYKIKIIRNYGLINLKEKILKNKFLISFLLVGLIILIFLSQMIFSVKVIHNNEALRNLLYNELSEVGIKNHKFKKSRNEIEKIKKDILKKYKDKIEWLEIEEIGTSYIIRVEERIIPNTVVDNSPRNIVAKKNAVIKKIEAQIGNVEKLRGEYVRKGDVIINGNIIFNENIKDIVHATGKVYGEVWYTIDITYPYTYQEEKIKNNITTNIKFNFLNKEILLFGKQFKYKKVLDEKKYSVSFMPIYLLVQKNKEIEKVDEILTCDQALNKAIEKGNRKIEKGLSLDEYIISSKVLETSCDIDKGVVKIFYTVYENITDYQIIN